MFVGWGVYPSVASLPYIQQKKVLAAVMKRSHPLFIVEGIAVILTGFLLGTVLGPIHTWSDVWGTAYGQKWLAAFLIASFSLVWGAAVSYKTTMNVLMKNHLWTLASNGNITPLRRSLLFAACLASVEIAGFIFILFLMVLL